MQMMTLLVNSREVLHGICLVREFVYSFSNSNGEFSVSK